MLRDFKAFLLRGNLLDLAVAFILGVAFAAVVTAFANIVLSFVAAIFGASTSFDKLTFTLNGAKIPYGKFLTALLAFLILAVALFAIVRFYQRLNPPPPSATTPCPYCKSSIPIGATRCPNCTSDLAEGARAAG
jgi:large conductance mechanosensitive channel